MPNANPSVVSRFWQSVLDYTPGEAILKSQLNLKRETPRRRSA